MKHEVTFHVPQCELSSSDIHIQVKEDGSVLGKLEVSKGAIVWYSRDMTYGHKMTWAQLDAIMETYPRKEKRKSS
jgi:hypothetical protein